IVRLVWLYTWARPGLPSADSVPAEYAAVTAAVFAAATGLHTSFCRLVTLLPESTCGATLSQLTAPAGEAVRTRAEPRAAAPSAHRLARSFRMVVSLGSRDAIVGFPGMVERWTGLCGPFPGRYTFPKLLIYRPTATATATVA